MRSAVVTVAAAGLAREAHGSVVAMADTTATGLIVALGGGGSFVLVLALTIRAARVSNRAGRAAAGQAQAAQARPGRARTRIRTRGGRSGAGAGAGVKTAKVDAYPPQPYSAHEPTSHGPYSRPYRVPAQDEQHGRAQTNGHRPNGPVGVPTAPWDPTED
ncbi:MAG TPA: hypothetical protein VGX23_20665 [Actinocrinis sp.]|nr:hypothetical protein [Actinocrinis sp.]